MQIKNKIILKIICLLSLVAFGTNLQADEFNISAKEISVDSAKDIVFAKGSVEVTDSAGRIIKGDKGNL